MAKSKFGATERAHQDEIFKKPGREPTNYGADVDKGRKQSSITSKISDGRMLHTHHDHETGVIKHTWLGRYSAAPSTWLGNKVVEGGDGPHPVEFYDARERASKAKWHYSRVGKDRNASFSKGIKHDYESQLLKRGVKDSNGQQTPLRKEGEEMEHELNELSKTLLMRYRKKKRDHAKGKINKELDDSAPKKKDEKKATSEELNIVDSCMVLDEISADPYLMAMEDRCNAMVDGLKEEMKQEIFDLREKKMDCTCDDDEDSDDDDDDGKKKKKKGDDDKKDKDDKKPAFLKKEEAEIIEDISNPQYPDLGVKVAKLRHSSDRKAHGRAVLDAFRSRQKSGLQRELPSHDSPSASGTWHSDGKSILKAVSQQNAEKMHRKGPARSEQETRKLYAAAMAEKNKGKK